MIAKEYSDSSLFEPDPKLQSLINRIPGFIGRVTIAGAFIVLLGWILDLQLFTSLSPSWPSMKVNSVICLFLSAWALLKYHRYGEQAGKLQWQIPAVIVALVGLVTLCQYAFHVDLRIDEIFFEEIPDPPRTSHPGRMAPSSALSFFLLGISFFLLKHESKTFGHPIAHYLAMIVNLMALFTFLTYTFKAEEVFGITRFTQMAIHTSFFLILLSIGIFFLRLNHSLFSIILSQGPGGIVARWLTVSGVLIPIALGLLRVFGERRAFFPLAAGTALFTVLIIACFLFVAWGTALMVSKAEKDRLKLLKEKESLKAQDELRERFISIIAHDLRTPLTAAKMSAQMIERRLQDQEATKGYVNRIAKQLDRSDLMIRDLLDLKKISQGIPLIIQPEDIDLVEFSRNIITEMELIYGNIFLLDVRTRKIWGHWDRDFLRRMVENLLSNAVKYGIHGVPITLGLRSANEAVEISVHNQGKPIPEEDQKRLFELFRRTEAAEISGQQGWGIGLAIVSALTEAMDGKVSVKSTADYGTTFTVRLPQDTRPKKA